MDFMDMLRQGMGAEGMDGKEDRDPITVDAFTPFKDFFDDRDFAVGTYVQKRSDDKDMDQGGLCAYKYPIRGEPALVVGHCAPPTSSEGAYNREVLIILAITRQGKPVRFAVDPVFFEKYELPGERMLREIEAEETEAAV